MTRKFPLFACLTFCFVAVAAARAQDLTATDRPGFDKLYQAAEKAREENRDDEAINLFRRALALRPESEESLWFLGTLYYAKGQYAEACDDLRRFLTLRPDAGPAWAFLGLGEFQLRQYPRALDHLQKAYAVGLGDRKELAHAVLYDTAVLLTRAERYDESLDILVRLLTEDAADPALVQPMGLAGLRLPFLPSEIPPDRGDFVELAGEAVLALESQHNQEAQSAFRKLVAAYPNEPGVHFLVGASLMQLHADLAIPEFEKELKVSPSHVLARVRIAEQLIAEGDFDRALSIAREAIRLDPRRASAHMLAGEALIAKGDSDAGLKELEEARDGDASVSRTHWDLLRAYAAAGRKDQAEKEKQQIDHLLRGSSSKHLGEPGDVSHN